MAEMGRRAALLIGAARSAPAIEALTRGLAGGQLGCRWRPQQGLTARGSGCAGRSFRAATASASWPGPGALCLFPAREGMREGI